MQSFSDHDKKTLSSKAQGDDVSAPSGDSSGGHRDARAGELVGVLAGVPAIEGRAKPTSMLEKLENSFATFTAEQVGRSHGLKTRMKNQKLEYVLEGANSERIVFACDATPEDIFRANQKISELEDAQIQQLERDFSVHIGKRGQEVYNVDKVIGHARKPNLRELEALEFGLEHSAPAPLMLKGKRLDINFLTEAVLPSPALAFHLDGVIYVQPSADGLGTEEPLDSASRLNLGLQQSTSSLGALFVHELAHRSQFNIGYEADSKRALELEAAMGWIRANSKTGEPLLKSKDSGLYKLAENDGQNSAEKDRQNSAEKDGHKLPKKDGDKLWYRCDKNGAIISQTGIGVDDMRKLALIPPATNYFVSPKEVNAEALMLYRMGPLYRTALLRRSPQLYELVEKQDQEEIDAAYGSGCMIRIQDGRLVARNASSLRSLADWRLTAEKSIFDIPPDIGLSLCRCGCGKASQRGGSN